MHLKLMRDDDGRPVDAFHIHGHAPPEETATMKKLIWEALACDDPLPPSLGRLDAETVSEPLALTQLILLHHLLRPGA
jgi:phosphoribulokinase